VVGGDTLLHSGVSGVVDEHRGGREGGGEGAQAQARRSICIARLD